MTQLRRPDLLSTPSGRVLRACLWLPLLSLLAAPALGQVVVNQISFPRHIGRTLDAPVTLAYTRTSNAAAVIQTVLAPQVTPAALPAGCRAITVGGDPAVECDVPAGGAGASGNLGFTVTAASLGSFSLVATGTGGSTASNTGTVQSSGELMVTKTLNAASPLLPGQVVQFTLRPALAAGADDLPAGSSITVTDQLPAQVAYFNVTAVNGGGASCNSAAAANSSRTLSCTISGPRTVAAVNAVAIVITGAPGTPGNFTNVGSVAAVAPGYFDRDPANNTANVDFSVDSGGDVQALGSFPSQPVGAGTAQTLTLSWRNNGPTALPAGGTVGTTVPAGFTVVSLPAGCSGPATGTPLAADTALSCTAAAGAAASTQSFAIPLLMPTDPPRAGSFGVTVAPPATFGDSVPANNSVSLPWSVLAPFADLRGSKTKMPASGPVAPGSPITTTLRITNDSGSTHAAVYSAAGGGTELRVWDYMTPTEIAGDLLDNVSAGWACTVSPDADPTAAATRTRRVECIRTAGGSLAPGAFVEVSFTTRVAPVSGQVTLTDRVCTGETVLASAAAGPQPAGNGRAGNDCATAGSELIATDVTNGSAGVTVRKESSVDGSTWVDPVFSAPTLTPAMGTQHWRITITTPSGGSQEPIPTLRLADTLPGILNVSSAGAPTYQTPAIAVTSTVTAGSAGGGCTTPIAAGSNTLACTFTAVAPGTTLVVSYSVARPFASGTLSNTATLSSPDALLSGTRSDAAAITVLPRLDVATTSKIVTPGTPRIGQVLQFTVTTQNLGPDDVASAGQFRIVDDLNTSLAGADVAFADISASGAGMACAVAGAALPDEAPLAAGHLRVRCSNTTPVPRYSVRTITISARVQQPATLPAAGDVYSAQVNSARVDIPDTLCEWKDGDSSACNDAGSRVNNVASATFSVALPRFDLQQVIDHVLPAGQSNFGFGQPLRYRLRLQNNQDSRAEGVNTVVQLTLPPGFTVASPRVFNVNAVAADSGYALDTSKSAASVACSMSAAAEVTCVLAASTAASFLDHQKEVNFELELQQTGYAFTPVTYTAEALICGRDASRFETSGQCSRSGASNNNLARVNDVVIPASDLAVTKSTVTPSPVGINQPVEFRLVARNLGPNPIQQIRVSDTLPPDFELVTSGAQAPSLALGSAVTASPSTATGAQMACTPTPATLTVPGQQQTVLCVIDALPGPLASGAFPGSTDAGNTLTIRLVARAKEGLFTGPYGSDRVNTAAVAPGLDGSGNPLTLDPVPGNNGSTSVVQLGRSSLAGRVYLDRNGNGRQDGSAPAQDEGIANVTVTLSGVDLFGNAITRTQTTVNTVGATRGDFLFDHLPPGRYTLTETQPDGYFNSPGAPVRPGTGGSYTAAASPVSSRWAGIDLPVDSAGTGYQFPESLPGAVVSGHVFSDSNGNGTLDPADGGLAGVTLNLYPDGTSCAAPAGAPLQTVVTDSTGLYRFTSVTVNSAYVICEVQPADHGDGVPVPGTTGGTAGVNQITIGTLVTDGSHDNDFPERLGRISGLVYVDRNSSGGLDGGEPGIGSPALGVPVTLTGTVAGGGPITRSTTTAADGSWRFDDLLPGTYTVTEGRIPVALGVYNDGSNSAGTVTGGTPGTAGAVGDNAIRNIVLTAAGAESVDNRFGEVPRTAIWGLVFVDADRDRALTARDTERIAGVTVELRQGGTSCSTGTLLGSTQTAADGSYVFPGGSVTGAQVVAGQACRVCERQPTDFVDGPTLPGDAASSARSDDILITALPATGSGSNHFGEWRRLGGGGGDVPSTITGTVFVDRNRDGALTSADPTRVAGVTVRLVGGDSCSGAEIGRTTTDAQGRYAFPGGNVSAAQVLAGQRYSLCEVQPSAYADGATLPGGSASTPAPNHIVIGALPVGGSNDNNFGEHGARIAGRVFLDRDNDGQPNGSDAGIGAVQVTLTGGDGAVRTATTAADGRFAFEDLPGGRWTLTEQPAQPLVTVGGGSVGTVDGKTTAGTGGGRASTPGSTPSSIADLQLPVAGESVDNLFAELLGIGISGTVYIDRNRDGTLTSADPGRIAGVTVRLVDGDSCSGTEIGRTRTDELGRYAFPGGNVGADRVVAGRRYSVCEQQPADHADGSTNPGTGGSTPAPNHIVIGALPEGGSSANDFGERAGRIAGRVFLDRNNDGQPNGNDVGIGGVTITLSGGDGRTRSTPTAPDGRFAFEDLPGGRWTLTEQAAQPPVTLDGVSFTTLDGKTTAGTGGGTATAVDSLPSRISDLLLPAGGDALDNLFAEVATASLAGRVWLDQDSNGRPDNGEPGIAGVTVVLTCTDDLGHAVQQTQDTGADGRYAFTGLRPGTCTVTEPSQPAGTRNGSTVPGSTGGTATGLDTLPSAISGIVLTAGQRSVDNNFGEVDAGVNLVVSKTAREARFVVGRPATYTIQVRNIGGGATEGRYTVSDRLPAGLTLAATPSGNGWVCTGAANDTRFSCSSSAVLAAGASAAPITLAVNVSAAAGNSAGNVVLVEGGGETPDRGPSGDERDRFDNRPDTLPICTPAAQQNTCRNVTEVVLPASLSGTVWLDGGSGSRVLDNGDTQLPGWVVELVDTSGRVVATTPTGPDGRYRFTDLEPGVPYIVRFRDPATGIVWGDPVNGENGTPAAPCNPQAQPSSCTGTRHDPLLRVVLAPGQELPQQSLPVLPSGVVYDSRTRNPVPGAVVVFTPTGSCPAWDPATQVAGAGLGGYTVAGNSIRMTTGSNGWYRFVLLEGAPARCLYTLVVEPPPAWQFPSTLIPPQPQPLQAGGTAGTAVRVQPQHSAPTGEVGPATHYHLQLDVGSSTADVVHNHIPVDPAAPAGLSLRKTGDRAVAELGDSVRYRITVSVAQGGAPRQVTVVDQLPRGFTYIAGTAVVDGRRIADPAGAPGPVLAFQLGGIAAGGSATLQYRVRVGVGAAEGDGINRATAHGCAAADSCVQPGTLQPLPTARASNEDRYRVRVAGGAFGLDACVVGKVFVDCNGNHVQDREELGIPGVRLVLQDGTFLTSDSEGKVSMCGLPPRSHVLRIDELTLPRGSRLVTSSNRNLGDAGSLWLDLKNGELQRADFIEGSCSNTVLDQVKARRAAGEVTVPQVEKARRPALRFDSRADARHTPTPDLPMNRPPPEGRRSSDAPATTTAEVRHGTR